MRYIPSTEDRLNWGKLAQHAYKEGKNEIGHTYSSIAAMDSLSERTHMLVSCQYQDWLHYGWWPNVNEWGTL